MAICFYTDNRKIHALIALIIFCLAWRKYRTFEGEKFPFSVYIP
jgi:hypothetical protein